MDINGQGNIMRRLFTSKLVKQVRAYSPPTSPVVKRIRAYTR